ncbi:histidinol-phosphatase HisJ family protein [Ornithinibacillus scapharcae]|uniref:histidinol-phosphatase HisJ family protein n=1 Tax=Ornithinibacillus scapharcae TaxID=1147159 RepID=UPI000225BF3B|nr:histidinol-phosphatase HisJ family protein [Ornithinibacillus scapharcae]
MFDYHIHSDFSADCKTPMERTVEKAIQIGLKEICFTEHIDFDYPDPTISFDLDLEQYNAQIKQMQVKYSDRIAIKKGIEIGIEPGYIERFQTMLKNEQFDFILCSMHTTERKDLHSGSFFHGKTVEEAYERYYEELLTCVKQFDNFSVLGHLDLVKRYKRGAIHHFHELISEIFKELINRGKGIELNTSGFRYGLGTGMPSNDILRLYRSLGGEIITIGSDSHTEDTLAFALYPSLDLLESLGFTYINTFQDNEPIFHSLNEVKQMSKNLTK